MCRLSFALALLPALAFAEPWPRHTIDDSARGADGVKLGDVNGDGLPDIATGWEEGGVIRVYLNPGAEQAKDRWPAVTVGRVGDPEDATFADVDGDGTLEVVSCCEGKTQAIFFHRLTDPQRLLDETAWTTERVAAADGRQWMQCCPIDMGHGGTGLIVGSKGEDAVVAELLPPDLPGDDWRIERLADAGWIMSLVVEDLLDEGVTELVYSDRKGPRRGIHVTEVSDDVARPRNHWFREASLWQEHEVMFLVAGVLDGTSKEIVAATRSGPLLRVRPFKAVGDDFKPLPGSPRKPRSPLMLGTSSIPMPPNTGTGKAVAIGDLNGDGTNDLAVTCENAKGKIGVFWLEMSRRLFKADKWTFHDVSGVEGTKFDRVELLDLDADGDLDVLTCEEREGLGVVWYENPVGAPQ